MTDHTTTHAATSRTTHGAAEAVLAIGPHQLNRIGDDLVTVTYPAGESTVLSVQPDGTLETRLEGAQGPYELARLLVDRLVYAPLGDAGPVYLVPYADTIPNA